MAMAALGALRERRAALEQEWALRVPQLRTAAVVPPPTDLVRAEVSESWMRSLPTVDPGLSSAPPARREPAWTRSPLYRPVVDLADELRSITEDAGFVAAVTDESGTIVWTCGGRVMRRRAERVNFAPGGRWDEGAMGTNALSLALRTGRPSTVFSAEHLVAALHGWVCYCAPVRGTDGRVLGVLDLSTTWDRSHPLALPTVRTLTSAIEGRLRDLEREARPRAPYRTGDAGSPDRTDSADREDRPDRPHREDLPDGGHGPGGRYRADHPDRVELTCLGAASAARTGARLHLPPRQLEILTLLALEPEGFSPERLRDALYGDRPVTASTFKAEVSHLRRALHGAVATRRYELTAPVECDAVRVLRALERGDTTTAVRLYRGPLLPASEAPGVLAWRSRLEVLLRESVLASAGADHALRYGERAPYDAEIHEHALRLLPAADPRRPLALSRLAAALGD